MYSGIEGVVTAAREHGSGILYAHGLGEGQTAYACARIMREHPGQILIIVSSEKRAEEMRDYLAYYDPDHRVCLFPDEERSLFAYEAKSRVNSYRRLECLTAMLEGREGYYLAPVMAAERGMCPAEKFLSSRIVLTEGKDAGRDLAQKLTELGYERSAVAEVAGQFSLRGEILDLFPPGSEYPYRIDFFDTEVESIRTFDPMTQRSNGSVDSVSICPSVLMDPEEAEEARYLWDYLQGDAMVVADDWDRLCETRDLAERDWASAAAAGTIDPQKTENFADLPLMAEALTVRHTLVTTPFSKKLNYLDTQAALIDVRCMAPPFFSGRMDLYGEELQRLLKEGYRVRVACSDENRVRSLREFAERSGIIGNVVYEQGSLPAGMYFTDDREAFLSDRDVFRSSAKKKRKKKKKAADRMAAFADFHEGDYVVHENHGIGQFVGIRPMVVDEIRRDYMAVRYAGGDMLYVPVEQMDLIQPYIGSGGAVPKVNKLSTADWSKTKARARAAIEHMAEELVQLSAERKMEFGYQFEADTPWQQQFEEQFPYEETEDQLRCIEEVKMDMESPWPMDRLLCGDVGFGKTEVAARAIFKCVMDGKQAALLVPTTLLARQHYENFKERFGNFPCNIEVLSRFRTDAQQKESIRKLAEGSVDVMIGTHRLLSKDVKFKDLGLLVIDEEQRFGVQHKEAIKKLKKNVDVLSMSATPIPRTLHMSLSGIRNMSTIEEPPQDRHPVQTYVMEEDDVLVREIIRREIDRGGQCFVVYNRVKGINLIAAKLRELLPEARIAVAHGRMDEKKLEDVMTDFIDHEYDVLVATTIIESGIDIPSANTLIVLDSDRYGLAQLYQLRGRVGRSSVSAYAYLMYQKNKVLSEVAERRLRAIREFTEFGSGFRIAMKDLEIRGAGNLLGVEQSGHMMMIGYELYCKMIDEAVRRLKGGAQVQEEELEVSVDITADAFISSEYIPEDTVRLDMYKEVASIRTAEDLQEISDEFTDRFGTIPSETRSLMKVALIRSRCREAGLARASEEGGRLVFRYPAGTRIPQEKALQLSEVFGNRIIVNLGSRPFIRVPVQKRSRKLDEALEFLEVLNSAL